MLASVGRMTNADSRSAARREHVIHSMARTHRTAARYTGVVTHMGAGAIGDGLVRQRVLVGT